MKELHTFINLKHAFMYNRHVTLLSININRFQDELPVKVTVHVHTTQQAKTIKTLNIKKKLQ